MSSSPNNLGQIWTEKYFQGQIMGQVVGAPQSVIVAVEAVAVAGSGSGPSCHGVSKAVLSQLLLALLPPVATSNGAL